MNKMINDKKEPLIYQGMIRKELEFFGHYNIDPRHVEAMMRMNHKTLDSLSPELFIHEILTNVECLKYINPELVEETAKSFGL